MEGLRVSCESIISLCVTSDTICSVDGSQLLTDERNDYCKGPVHKTCHDLDERAWMAQPYALCIKGSCTSYHLYRAHSDTNSLNSFETLNSVYVDSVWSQDRCHCMLSHIHFLQDHARLLTRRRCDPKVSYQNHFTRLEAFTNTYAMSYACH